jgi:lysylphosphatidylglycerol synthetase-like protein (DUF2156 family)
LLGSGLRNSFIGEALIWTSDSMYPSSSQGSAGLLRAHLSIHGSETINSNELYLPLIDAVPFCQPNLKDNCLYSSFNIFDINLNSNTNPNRPIGVTIIAILAIIGGIALLIGGLLFIAFAGILSSTETTSNNPIVIASLISLPLGLGMAIIGIIYLAVSYGLLKGKGWAWVITVIVTIIGLIIQIVSAIITGLVSSSIEAALVSHVIGIIIGGVIIFYLYRPHVRAYFKR